MESDELELITEARDSHYKSMLHTQHGIECFTFWERPMLTQKKNIISNSTPVEYTWMFTLDRDKRRRQQRVLSIKIQQIVDVETRIKYMQEIAALVWAEHNYRQDNEVNQRFYERNKDLFREFQLFINTELKAMLASYQSTSEAKGKYSDLVTREFRGYEDKFDEVLLIEKLIDSERNWIGQQGAARYFWKKMIEAGVFKPSPTVPASTAATIFATTFAGANPDTFEKAPKGEKDNTSRVAKKYDEIPARIQLVIGQIKSIK